MPFTGQWEKDPVAIAAESDATFRRFLGGVEDPRILEGLQAGFPHLFRRGLTPPVPASRIREHARQWASSQQSGDEEFASLVEATDWYHVLEGLGIPVAHEWHNGAVPKEICSLLIGKLRKAGIMIILEDKEYIVASINAGDVQDAETPISYPESTEGDEPYEEWLVLVEPCHLDLNA